MPQLGFDFVPPASDAEWLLRTARGLPNDKSGLVKAAPLLLRDLNRAIVKKQPAYRDHLARFRALASKYGDEDELAKELAAVPGKVPIWGQAGQFITIAAGCRMMIDWPAAGDADLGAFDAYAIDFDRPWLTSTGYCDFGGWFNVETERRNVYAYVKRRVEQSQRRMVGGKWYTRPLEEIVKSIYDDDQPPGPPQGDPTWAEGGWIYEYLKSHPLPEVP